MRSRAVVQCGIAQHASQHVEQPGAAFVADGLVAIGKMRGVQALAEGYRAGVAQPLSIFILAQEIAAIFFENLAELRRVLLLQHQ